MRKTFHGAQDLRGHRRRAYVPAALADAGEHHRHPG
jgi:hypothetical protein